MANMVDAAVLASSSYASSRLRQGTVRTLTLGASAGACCTGAAVSLYAQCAASPYSASMSMLLVRSCTSSGTPPGPRTAVCSDW